jgi:hypothetical protein
VGGEVRRQVADAVAISVLMAVDVGGGAGEGVDGDVRRGEDLRRGGGVRGGGMRGGEERREERRGAERSGEERRGAETSGDERRRAETRREKRRGGVRCGLDLCGEGRRRGGAGGVPAR